MIVPDLPFLQPARLVRKQAEEGRSACSCRPSTPELRTAEVDVFAPALRVMAQIGKFTGERPERGR